MSLDYCTYYVETIHTLRTSLVAIDLRAISHFLSILRFVTNLISCMISKIVLEANYYH